MWLSPAHARPAVHVGGSSTLDGTTMGRGPESDVWQLRGRLSDELGAPIANEELTLFALNDAHERSPILAFSTCSTTDQSNSLSAHSRRPSAVFTASDGGFCVRLDSRSHGKGKSVIVRYEGSQDYIGTQLILAPPDLRLALSGRFESLPDVVSLDEDATTFSVSITPLIEPNRVGNRTLTLELSLADESTAPSTRLIQRLTTTVDKSTRLSLSRKTLGDPGPAEFVLSFPGDEQVAPLVVHHKFLRTTKVTLKPLELPSHMTAGDSFRLKYVVTSPVALVTSGTVELTLNDAQTTLAPVSNDGKTEFFITTQTNQSELNLALRYLPDRVGFIAAPLQTRTIRLVAPSPWRFTLWIVTGLLVLVWLGCSRRRPAKTQPPPNTSIQTVPRAHLEVIGPPSKKNEGWEGLVVDAHEGRPISAVRITLFRQGFERDRVLYEVTSDAQGRFSIRQNVVPMGIGCELRVEAVAYAAFTTELPSPGKVKLHLVSVRRALLDRLVAWVSGRDVPFRSRVEPSPEWVAQVARQRGYRNVELWAQAISVAAFGKDPPLNAQHPNLVPPTGPNASPIKRKQSE